MINPSEHQPEGFLFERALHIAGTEGLQMGASQSQSTSFLRKQFPVAKANRKSS
jgi:hypothetical protein